MGHRNKAKWTRKPKGLLALLLWFSLSFAIHAQNQTISQMIHTSWRGRDGAPQGITALAQTPDGILWIGGFGGLFTFDGVKFEAYLPKPGSLALPGGTIRFDSRRQPARFAGARVDRPSD